MWPDNTYSHVHVFSGSDGVPMGSALEDETAYWHFGHLGSSSTMCGHWQITLKMQSQNESSFKELRTGWDTFMLTYTQASYTLTKTDQSTESSSNLEGP